MQVTTMKPLRVGPGIILLAAGVLCLAVALTIYLSDDSGGGSPSAAVTAPLNAYTDAGAGIAFWEERVRNDPLDFVAYNRLGNLYLKRARETGDVADYGRAQSAVDASLASLPGENYDGYALLGALQNVRHEFAAAADTARRAIGIDPADPYAYAVLGDAQLNLGRYDEALATYNDLVNRAPGLSSFSRLAHIRELRGELDEAEGAWENALELDSRTSAEATAWARVQFGNFYFNQGRLSEADAQYTAALQTLSGYVHGLAASARVAAARGDYEHAIDQYTQVTERQPLPEYVAALGDTYAAAGRDSEAAQQYELIGVIAELYQANGISTDLQLAVFFADHDVRIGDGVQAALAVYHAQPDSIYASDAVAWALYKGGRPQEAAPYAAQALRLGTPDASLLYHAGMIEKALGNDSEAHRLLTEALGVNPHFSSLHAPIARAALEELGG